LHNGQKEQFKGYCMDVYTNQAIDFISRNKEKPFFVYLATNTPHWPLIVSEKYSSYYKDMGMTDKTSKVYGMVENIDENFGRLLAKVKEFGLEENTIIIFASDNGPCGVSSDEDRYMAGLRGHKGLAYENGIRVPFFIRWPNGFKGGHKINQIASHIDLFPTLLDACNIKKPANLSLDGLSLIPLLQEDKTDWPDRTLYFQWHRGNKPQIYRNFAVRNQKFKLVQVQGCCDEREFSPDEFKFELFDISKDPFETNDISGQYPEKVRKMKKDYEKWFKDVCGKHNFEPPEIYIGSRYENPIRLTNLSKRSEGDDKIGCWKVRAVNPGKYEIRLILGSAVKCSGKARLRFGDIDLSEPIDKGKSQHTFNVFSLKKMTGRLKGWVESGGEQISANMVDIKRLD